jgi:uncharacterized LabA/DUF88 family protein
VSAEPWGFFWRYGWPAVLIDGGFYQKRAHFLWGPKSPHERAQELVKYCIRHLKDEHEKRSLYRIFYYDCPPLSKKQFHPLTQRTVDLSKSDLYIWMTAFLNELRSKRKLALRLGQLAESQTNYILKPDVLKKLCRGVLNINTLKEEDFILDVTQKGVDMKVGLDISSLAYKKQVNQIVLISGDSDFIPAAKHARREGIDFILDPLWANIKPELQEHIDGLRTCCPRPSGQPASFEIEK